MAAFIFKVKVALLVPGWVNTSIVLKVKQEEDPEFDKTKIFNEENPASGAWMPSQIIDYMLQVSTKKKDTQKGRIIAPLPRMVHEIPTSIFL